MRMSARFMAAADAFFYMPAHEAKAAMIADAVARGEGLRGKAAAERRAEILHGTDQQEIEWRAQIEREAQAVTDAGMPADRLWRARRLRQLRESNRSAAVAESAADFALRMTYNNQTHGLLGVVADGVLLMRRRVPQAAFVVPFVNIVINVANESINYTPWGAARGIAAARTGVPSVAALWNERMREGQTAMPSDAVVDLHVKAALGTLAVAAFAFAAAAGADDDDGRNFQIYGAGPRRSDGRLDAEKARQLRAGGKWLPYSVRIGGKAYSFQNTPLVVPLGIIGNYLDEIGRAHV